MLECMNRFEADEFQKILGLLPALRIVQAVAELQAEEHVAEDGEPRKERGFLKHHEAVGTGPDNGLAVGLNQTPIGPSSPAMILSNVDFPQPLGPTRQTNSPSAMRSVTSSSA